MKRLEKRLLLPLIVSLVVLFVSLNGFAAADPVFPTGSGEVHAPDQILVKFKPGVPKNEIEKVHLQNNGKVIDVIPEINVQVVRVEKDKALEKVSDYKRNPHIEFAEPDYVARAVFTPNDPKFNKQWGMDKIEAGDIEDPSKKTAWDVIYVDPNIKIAILDTGIDQNHEDLMAKIEINKNFTSSWTVDDKYGHGTHVAGVAAAATDNGIGVAGVGFNSRLINVKVLGDNGSGYYSWVASGIIWAADNEAKVINLSLGGGSLSTALQNAVDYAWGKGCVIVAAAGNSNTDKPLYPAYYDNCIAVAATDQSDKKASFSNYGSWVDIAAPGVNIFSTVPNHKNRLKILNYGSLSGTSMATPHIAGTAALVFAKDPKLNNADVRSIIVAVDNTDPATGFSTSIRRVNAYKAVLDPPSNSSSPIPGGGEAYAPDQILVKFKPGSLKNEIDKVHLQNNGKVIDAIPEIDVQVVRVEKSKALEKISAYKSNPHVEFAELDYIAQAFFTPDDLYFEDQWGMDKIQAGNIDPASQRQTAWDITDGDKKIKIAILDTGIDQDHEDLANKIIKNKDFTSSSTGFNDMNGHGTHVAGIAAAATDNEIGVAGVGYNCKLMNGKVFGDDGWGKYSWIANGIIWAANHGAEVINISGGGKSPSRTLEEAVHYAWNVQGVVLVAAAGSHGGFIYPAAYPNCIAVGATNEKETRASFSNPGPWVDIAAPGVNILSTTPNHENYLHNYYGVALDYAILSGTSMACPHVAGTAALVFAEYPDISNTEVRTRIEAGVDQAIGFKSPIGRLNAYNAVNPEAIIQK